MRKRRLLDPHLRGIIVFFLSVLCPPAPLPAHVFPNIVAEIELPVDVFHLAAEDVEISANTVVRFRPARAG
jgi:hypothetical protein